MIEISDKSLQRFKTATAWRGTLDRHALRANLEEGLEFHLVEVFDQWLTPRPAALYRMCDSNEEVTQQLQMADPFYRVEALREWLGFLAMRAAIINPYFYPDVLYATREWARLHMPERIYADYHAFVYGLFNGHIRGRGRYVGTVMLRHLYGWQLRNPAHVLTRRLDPVIESIVFAMLMADD